MAAIVLDHEKADEETGRRHRQQKAKPIANVERGPHQDPEERSGTAVITILRYAALRCRPAIAGEDLRPGAHIGRARGRCRRSVDLRRPRASPCSHLASASIGPHGPEDDTALRIER